MQIPFPAMFIAIAATVAITSDAVAEPRLTFHAGFDRPDHLVNMPAA